MAKQRVGDIDIYYEVHGAGATTLVMIRGLGSNLTAWYEQTPEFARHFRTVIFDNRGAGRTDKPDAPYSIAQMAADTAGLMDGLAIRRAALLGISMGGMIAQEFVLHYPERLSCLILGCTNFGGAGIVQADPAIVSAVVAGVNATPDQQKLQLKAVFGDDTIEHRRDVLAKHEEMRAQFPIPLPSFMRQVQAIQNFDASARLASIKVPTMVIAGRDDRLVPVENSRMITARIPGAKLVELPGGHLFFVEHPAEFNRAVIDFVSAHQ
jgi:pimeloyl-ACP methyl ester carboxylesterase